MSLNDGNDGIATKKAPHDGGSISYRWEKGQRPTYCMQKYTGSDAQWWGAGGQNVCKGGN